MGLIRNSDLLRMITYRLCYCIGTKCVLYCRREGELLLFLCVVVVAVLGGYYISEEFTSCYSFYVLIQA